MLRLVHAFFAAWLLLALPLGQLQAQAHALDHAIDEGTPAQTCADHSLYAPFAGAVGTPEHRVTLAQPAEQVLAARPIALASRAPLRTYLSRAPPASPAIA